MMDIERKHFSPESQTCIICTDPVLYKAPPTEPPTQAPLSKIRAQPLPMPPALDGSPRYEQMFYHHGPVARQPPPAPSRPAEFRPAFSTYAGARYFLGHGCNCTAALCVACATTWRQGEPKEACERYYERQTRCPNCNVLVTFRVPARSLITGRDRQKYLKLYKLKLRRKSCRYVFPARGRPLHCPHGTKCHYSHMTRDGQLLQQHQPGHRQRKHQPVEILRRADAAPPPPIVDLTAENNFHKQ
jgi:hypothetical protein